MSTVDPWLVETILTIVLSILVLLLVAALSFYAGVRYCADRMLPGIMARKTEKELDELADEVEAERIALGLPTEGADEEAA